MVSNAPSTSLKLSREALPKPRIGAVMDLVILLPSCCILSPTPFILPPSSCIFCPALCICADRLAITELLPIPLRAFCVFRASSSSFLSSAVVRATSACRASYWSLVIVPSSRALEASSATFFSASSFSFVCSIA